jgi:hypothetical protein
MPDIVAIQAGGEQRIDDVVRVSLVSAIAHLGGCRKR